MHHLFGLEFADVAIFYFGVWDFEVHSADFEEFQKIGFVAVLSVVLVWLWDNRRMTLQKVINWKLEEKNI